MRRVNLYQYHGNIIAIQGLMFSFGLMIGLISPKCLWKSFDYRRWVLVDMARWNLVERSVQLYPTFGIFTCTGCTGFPKCCLQNEPTNSQNEFLFGSTGPLSKEKSSWESTGNPRVFLGLPYLTLMTWLGAVLRRSLRSFLYCLQLPPCIQVALRPAWYDGYNTIFRVLASLLLPLQVYLSRPWRRLRRR